LPRCIQEVQAAAAEALKEMLAYEKQEVGLEEKRKHANGKAKKLKKLLQDVCFSSAPFLRHCIG
jgi:structural maintenance of chromosome 4